jgi:60 kDa SS-A/Ro ribonucleoprotein
MPRRIQDALSVAADVALENAPLAPGKTVILVDCSGSMDTPVTGARKHATKISCRMAAGNLAAAMFKRNDDAHLMAFATNGVIVKANHRDTITTIADAVTRATTGGTDIGGAINAAIHHFKPDTIVVLSDNESWMDSVAYVTPPSTSGLYGANGRPLGTSPPVQTKTSQVFGDYRRKDNHKAKLVLYDFTPNTSSQVPANQPGVLRVGGFSDAALTIMQKFFDDSSRYDGATAAPKFTDTINAVRLDSPKKEA